MLEAEEAAREGKTLELLRMLKESQAEVSRLRRQLQSAPRERLTPSQKRARSVKAKAAARERKAAGGS